MPERIETGCGRSEKRQKHEQDNGFAKHVFRSPAHRLEQHQPGWPIAGRETLLSDRPDSQRKAAAQHARLLLRPPTSDELPARWVRNEPVCYTILFKHIPSKKACSFPKNMSGIWPVK